MQYNEQLAQYGILAKNAKAYEMRQDKIILSNIEIEEIDLKTLEEQKIKELVIENSKINNLLFAQINNIKLFFGCCNFKNQVIAREHNFINTIAFTQCIFETIVDFSGATFNCQTTFLNSIFKAEAFFDHAEFQGGVSFEMSRFKAETSFINTKFSAKQGNNKIAKNNFQDTIFEGYTFFDHAEFKGRVNFESSRFKDEVLFVAINLDKCIFDHIEFNKTKFIKIDYKNAETCTFRNSTFKDTLSFENTDISKLEFDNVVFNGIVTFNEANFSNKPSFTNCTFSNQFNIEHQYIKYSYEDIIEETQDYSQLLNYRDLFRKLKSNRIAHHNLIDASELHSQELYAREFELQQKETKTIKEHIEKWQLWFYHKLCDHHTDLLLNLKWLIIAIGLFASLYFISRLIQDISILEILNPFGICFSIACAFIALILYWFRHIERLDFFASINAVITLWIICYKPQLIFGIANLLGNIKYNGFENFLITIYTIVIGLIIFSLQKTARKNSIVPN
ncbi:pentapeptide repeat-containing protein [Helicobacter sp. 10-6591]|uniref:pentapeptide repeat-containing protein n=1 Tax=Helicobacter sp. 10-6591 TaxID=2004998 RepID=UPI000DCC4D36|nr:pentapeptide repeat-containing protein [Helicobacter sp. 10-6591]RAX52025.1 hypothetical protein CCY97_07865 [Helicobacter sp. 10-6591]